MSDNFIENPSLVKFEPFPMNGAPHICETAIPVTQLEMEHPGRVAEFPMQSTGQQLASQSLNVAVPVPTLRAAVAASSRAPTSGVNYCLRNAKSGHYLAADGTEENANCSQKTFTGGDNQVWYLYQAAGSGYFQLIPRVAPTKRLTVIPGGSASGANVGITAGSSTTPTKQEWAVTTTSRGSCKLLSRCSNNAMALAADPSNMNLDGGNVAQYAYTDDATANDEWILEPFIAPFMEYDQGYFMYHSNYSGYAIQQQLKAFADQVGNILYSEFGLRCRPSANMMIPSLADECSAMLYSCEHGGNSACTNSYNSEEDGIHHKNWSKQLYWYINRGRQPNGLHILWNGHPKCIQLATGTGATQHAYFQMAQRYYYQSTVGSPFMVMNLPLNVSPKQMVALLLAGISAIFGANTASHNVNCVADPACNTQTIYDRVLGASPALSSFWCNDCKSLILNNLDRFSRSAP